MITGALYSLAQLTGDVLLAKQTSTLTLTWRKEASLTRGDGSSISPTRCVSSLSAQTSPIATLFLTLQRLMEQTQN